MVKYMGTAASGGLAVAKIKIVNRRITGFKRVVLATHREKALFDAAIILAKDELQHLMGTSDSDHRDILNFQLVLLDDCGMKELVLLKIDSGMGGALAVEEAMEEYCLKIRALEDEYFSERASDIRDVLTRVVDILDGRSRERFTLQEPMIIVADEILPSDLATIDRELALGFITVGGSYQSHANIIARTMGIPSVCCVDGEMLNPIFTGKVVALDGYSGEVFLSPADSTLALFTHRMSLEKRDTVLLQNAKLTSVIHPCGDEIAIYANCNDPKDIALAISNGALGIGLVRSEILFMSKTYDPTIASQIQFYSQCILAAEKRPITIRTFDIGADKPIGGVSYEKEPNPALGVRGVRLMYRYRQLFMNQIEALFIAADKCGQLDAMIPMVSTVKEVTDYMALVEEVKGRLFAQGTIEKDNITWGIMIETPCAALISDELAPLVRFFSIGTNDLTQYTLAADRVNTNMTPFYDPLHPSVIKLMAMTVKNAQDAGIRVSVCGESAADFESVKVYIELGIRCLSMAQNAMLPIKQHLLDLYKQ